MNRREMLNNLVASIVTIPTLNTMKVNNKKRVTKDVISFLGRIDRDEYVLNVTTLAASIIKSRSIVSTEEAKEILSESNEIMIDFYLENIVEGHR